MDDDEAAKRPAFDAEATLLALGPSLDWVEVGPQLPDVAVGRALRALGSPLILTRSMVTDAEIARHSIGCYTVVLVQEGEGGRVYACALRSGTETPAIVCPRRFAIYTTAKAACERHHATGKWE